MRDILVDAGPMVALIDRSDPDHRACVTALQTLRAPLVTVWPAFTEAMYLAGRSWQAQRALWSRLEQERWRSRRSTRTMRRVCAS